MLDYSEKRDFLRMNMDCPARYRLDGAEQAECALVRNLSGNGVLLETERPMAAEAEFSLEILPGKTITPALAARARVVRCAPGAEGNYSVACTITRILEEEEVGPDFP